MEYKNVHGIWNMKYIRNTGYAMHMEYGGGGRGGRGPRGRGPPHEPEVHGI